MKLNRILKLAGIGVAFTAVFLIVMAGATYFVQILWNWLVPDLFAGPVLTFWQTLGLLVLAKIVLWPLRGGRGGHWGHRMKGPGLQWNNRWESMSPEDRARFKEKMWEKWCMPRKEVDSGPQSGAGAA